MLLKKFSNQVDRIFDWAYTSKYNPLYKSGVLASGLLFFVILTGFYLLLFYRISSPYESMVNIQNNIWFGSLVRSLHRYASDLTVVVVGFHIFRMIVEKKTWGPRIIAWLSGVLLLAFLFFSGWTGYVMVWDRHGQKLAIMGARLLDSLNILAEPLSRAFSGATPVLGSFFFMNLFLHVAIPLGMILGLWIHTSRIARTNWFPVKKVSVFVVFALLLLSLFMPAPLASEPHLFKIGGVDPTDWFFNFWLHWDGRISHLSILMYIVLFFTFLISMPLWYRPYPYPEKSKHNQKNCEGCKQCVLDCPYEAILMVPRTQGEGSAQVAFVNEDLCVACGICSGSCSQLAIGPLIYSANSQLEKVMELRKAHGKDRSGVVVVYCDGNFKPESFLNFAKQFNTKVDYCSFGCSGQIHPAVIQTLLLSYEKVFAITCPADACKNREGTWIFKERVYNGRSPANTDKLPKERVYITSGARSDLNQLTSEFEFFISEKKHVGFKHNKTQIAKAFLMTYALFSFIGYFSKKPMGQDPGTAFIRLSWKIPRQTTQECKKLTVEQMNKLPFHMKKDEECVLTSIKYNVKLIVNNEKIFEKQIVSQGARHDKPLFIDELVKVKPGVNAVKISFYPENNIENKQVIKFEKEYSVNSVVNYATVIGWEAQQGVYLIK